MSWKINYDKDSSIIEVTYIGNVSGMDIREATEKRISVQAETGATRVLADASQSLGGPSTMEIYDLPDKIYVEYESRRDTRIAFILPTNKQSRELANFFQTAAKNRGWMIELFENREDALFWLTNIR